MSYRLWTDPPTPPASQGIAKHGHFRHKHRGDCTPCRGWGFVEVKIFLPFRVVPPYRKETSLQVPADDYSFDLHYIRCRDCKGCGNVGVFG